VRVSKANGPLENHNVTIKKATQAGTIFELPLTYSIINFSQPNLDIWDIPPSLLNVSSDIDRGVNVA
jgi:hypothetical protein